MAKLTVPVNTGGGSGPLENKVYKKDGQTKITLKQKIEDLKNWFYEFTPPHLFDVPNWNDVPYSENGIQFYIERTSVGDDRDVTVVTVSEGTEQEEMKLIEIFIDSKRYIIVSEDYENYEKDKWYDVTSSSSEKQIDTPQIELNSDNVITIINGEPTGYETIFNAIYGTEQVLLKDKFADVYRAIDENVDDSILKTKLYDDGVTELENNKTYQFKEDCSDFFTSFNLSGSAPVEIYYKNVETEPDDPTPSMPTNNSGSGIRLMSINDSAAQEEEVLYIACGVQNGQKGISVGTYSNQYLFIEDNGSWTPSTPPDLTVDEQYVKNADMLKTLLQGGQTLEQKFNEEIKNWNYSKGKAENKPLFDVTNIFPTVFNLLGQANLLPSNNSSVSNVILYVEPNKIGVRYNCTRNSSKYMFFIEWVDIANNETIYGCSINAGSTFSFSWVKGIIGEGKSQPDFSPITSQEELLSFTYNAQYVSQGINPEIITNLITTYAPKMTLEEKINDLKNWLYEEKELDSSALKPVFDTANVLMNNMQTFGQAGMFSNVTNEVLYSQNELEVYWTFDDGTITITWKVPNEDEQYYNVYENIIQEESSSLVSSWNYYTQPFDFVQGDIYTTTPINSQEELPEITIDETLIETGYENALPLLYENVKVISKITLKDKFESCLTLTRLFNITIPSTSITESNNNDYSLTPYSYIWKVTLEDDAFKDALKIETIFDLDEITPENICPFQDIDTENGTLTLYVKEKSDIVISRIDIFKNNK